MKSFIVALLCSAVVQGQYLDVWPQVEFDQPREYKWTLGIDDTPGGYQVSYKYSWRYDFVQKLNSEDEWEYRRLDRVEFEDTGYALPSIDSIENYYIWFCFDEFDQQDECLRISFSKDDDGNIVMEDDPDFEFQQFRVTNDPNGGEENMREVRKNEGRKYRPLTSENTVKLNAEGTRIQSFTAEFYNLYSQTPDQKEVFFQKVSDFRLYPKYYQTEVQNTGTAMKLIPIFDKDQVEQIDQFPIYRNHIDVLIEYLRGSEPKKYKSLLVDLKLHFENYDVDVGQCTEIEANQPPCICTEKEKGEQSWTGETCLHQIEDIDADVKKLWDEIQRKILQKYYEKGVSGGVLKDLIEELIERSEEIDWSKVGTQSIIKTEENGQVVTRSKEEMQKEKKKQEDQLSEAYGEIYSSSAGQHLKDDELLRQNVHQLHQTMKDYISELKFINFDLKSYQSQTSSLLSVYEARFGIEDDFDKDSIEEWSAKNDESLEDYMISDFGPLIGKTGKMQNFERALIADLQEDWCKDKLQTCNIHTELMENTHQLTKDTGPLADSNDELTDDQKAIKGILKKAQSKHINLMYTLEKVGDSYVKFVETKTKQEQGGVMALSGYMTALLVATGTFIF